MYKKYEELLKKTGKTSYQVSKDTGIAENIFSYWKNGRSTPKVDKLQKLAKYFGVDIDYFWRTKNGKIDSKGSSKATRMRRANDKNGITTRTL